MESNALIHPAQSGFCPRHSTQDLLVKTVDIWRKALDKDEVVGTVFVDLSKAFDMIDHSQLLAKLYGYGMRGKELMWLENYLRGRKQRVLACGEKSVWSSIGKGVPQGSILGPLLFTVFANSCKTVHSQSLR